MQLLKKKFGHLDDGTQVHLFTLSNGSMEVSATNFGGIITSIKVPNRDGIISETVLGFNNLDDYKKDHPYFGALVGPVANRISNATFSLNGQQISVDANEGLNQLHGGTIGFDKVAWNYKTIKTDNYIELILTFVRPDGLMGFPGNLDCLFTIRLNKANKLDLNYLVKTDKATPVNLTHHEYFNLADGGLSSSLDHSIQINAGKYTPTKDNNCVTGEIIDVKGTAFDFRNANTIRQGIKQLYGYVKEEKGFDHNFILDGASTLAATVKELISGRQLDIYTNQPCLQFYTGSYLDGKLKRDNVTFEAFRGFCLETQSYPDAVNQSHFPSIILQPNEIYDYFVSYVFSNF